jgi:hypothetical protein
LPNSLSVMFQHERDPARALFGSSSPSLVSWPKKK